MGEVVSYSGGDSLAMVLIETLRCCIRVWEFRGIPTQVCKNAKSLMSRVSDDDVIHIADISKFHQRIRISILVLLKDV
jgi:hypothetical protein